MLSNSDPDNLRSSATSVRREEDDDDNFQNDVTELFNSITEDNLEKFKTLITVTHPTTDFLAAENAAGETVLHLIVRTNKEAFIQEILNAKAYSRKLLEIENKQKETAWQLAVAAGIEEQFARRTLIEVQEAIEYTKAQLKTGDTNPELAVQIGAANNMINAAQKAVDDLEMIPPAEASSMIASLTLAPEVIKSDPNDNAEALRLFDAALAKHQAESRSWSRVFAASMATILCLSLLAIAISISVAAVGVPVPFVAAGLGVLGITLTENAIVASIGFGLFVPSLTGFSALFGMYAVKHVPTKNDHLYLSGIKP